MAVTKVKSVEGFTKGVKTSEFWCAFATTVAAVIAAVAGILPAEWAAVIGAVSQGLYALSRGLAKK